MECEFCKSKLISKSNLNYYKKTNKSCLLLQSQLEIAKIKCEYCNKNFTSNQTIKVHKKNCKIKNEKERNDEIDILKKEKFESSNKILLLEKEIQLLKKENNILENTILELKTENKIFAKDHEFIHKIASQPKTTTTNNKINVINNIFSQHDKVKELLDTKLTTNHIVDGQKGIAHFAFNTLLKDDNGNINYFCTDLSRNIFKFQNSEGELEKDIKANKLTDLIVSSGLKNKTCNIANNLWTKEDGSIDVENFRLFNPHANEIIMIESDNSIFRNELASLTAI